MCSPVMRRPNTPHDSNNRWSRRLGNNFFTKNICSPSLWVQSSEFDLEDILHCCPKKLCMRALNKSVQEIFIRCPAQFTNTILLNMPVLGKNSFNHSPPEDINFWDFSKFSSKHHSRQLMNSPLPPSSGELELLVTRSYRYC